MSEGIVTSAFAHPQEIFEIRQGFSTCDNENRKLWWYMNLNISEEGIDQIGLKIKIII